MKKLLTWLRCKLFLYKIKANNGVHTSFREGEPILSMFERSCVFLNDKEKRMFADFITTGKVKQHGFHRTQANREGTKFIEYPVFK